MNNKILEALDTYKTVDDNDINCEVVEIFESEEDMRKSLIRFCYGDLYIIGRIWIEAMKTVLLGAKLCLVPTVKAEKPPAVPEKPPKMKYSDLPLYKSPHYEYKEYLEDKMKCPEANVKLLHRFLLPHVTNCRKQTAHFCSYAKCTMKCTCKNMCNSIKETNRDFKKFMRDPDNITLRQAVLLMGGVTGYLLGSGRGVPRRLFFTGLGTLTAGALCFPEETDEGFRNFVYYTGKSAIGIYNFVCGKEFTLRERLPCKDDKPIPGAKLKVQCQKK